MRTIQISGSLPASMAENSGAGDWSGGLNISGDLAGLVSVRTIGRDGAYFAADWNAALGFLSLSPGTNADAEALAAAGHALELSFGLRFRFADGTQQDTAPALYQVAVLDVDDTAPQTLRFASGGQVAADALGAVIGTLAVGDPDSAGPFFFSLIGDDDWRFEIVGQTLQLRGGINLGLDAMGTYPLIVEVSDGRQSAAFTLDVQVTGALDPALPNTLLLAPGEEREGFAFVAGDAVLALRGAEDVAAVTAHPGTIRQFSLADGNDLWLDATVARLRFAEGFLEFAPAGTAMRAAALHAALGDAADAATLGRDVAALEGGQGWIAFARGLATTGGSDAAFVLDLWRSAFGQDPGTADLVVAQDRLADGLSRAQLAVEIVLAPEAMARFAATHPDGLWVFQPLGGVALADPGGLLPSPAAAPAPELFLL